LTNKKSRTADDFPFHKLSKGALRRVKRGWSRTATQNVKIGRQTAFTMQASVWRDKKQVAMLHNVDVIQPDQDTHKVLRMSPNSKKKKEVNSPRVISSYSSTYNGVDRKDRDTSDWTISVKSHRWYLRLYYWMVDAAIHSSYLLVVHIANKRAEINPEHPWLKYSGRNGRMNFQMDLAHSLMEKGLLLDCPDVANFKKPKLRPRYSRKKDYHPCESDNCFFCNIESHMECSTRSPRHPGFESLSPDSQSPLRCLLRHQVSIQRRRNLWDQVRVKFVGKECRVWKSMKERL
jgi:hypothetical protein